MLLGVDTGGTFTDFVLWDSGDIRTHKVLSTPDNPAQAILQGVRELGLDLNGLQVIHGSTVATNAVLEGKLARTVFVTNHGLKDLLTIGRQARRELYNLTPANIRPPVDEALCLEVNGRMDAQGKLLEPFSGTGDQLFVQQLEKLKPDSVAINLLFSFIDPGPEEHIESLVPGDVFVTRSSSLLPVYREYERGMTTWLNAATGPLMQKYLGQLEEQLRPAALAVMQSSGDVIDAGQAGKQPVRLLLSGPAGGLLAARSLGKDMGYEQLMTFDMGGTSTDVALIDRDIRQTDDGHIAGYPVAVPMVDMHTIGAGGGSLAWLDEGGLLHVGPQSAGASPGPACYGQGGTQPTVTDANAVLGHLPSQVSLGGYLNLDIDAACTAVTSIAEPLGCSVEDAARGIVGLANEHMAAALRVISVEKGYDPKEFILASFGGAGGLHVCDLAEHLGMTRALAPMHAGVLSAYGMLVAPKGRRYMRTFIHPMLGFDEGHARSLFDEMEAQGMQSLVRHEVTNSQVSLDYQADIRYIGQSSTLRVVWGSQEAMARKFHQQHEKRFGYSLEEPLELVNLHCAVQLPAQAVGLATKEDSNILQKGEQRVSGIEETVPVYDRQSIGMNQDIEGPAIIIESSATTWVKPGWIAAADQYGNLLLSRHST